MIYVPRGVTREVLLIGPWAVKVPKLRYGWRAFLRGLLANIEEAAWGRATLDGFCPVVLVVPGGWLVVQRRARSLTLEEWDALDFEAFRDRAEYSIPVEYKRDSFGVVDGQIVAVDYGGYGA